MPLEWLLLVLALVAIVSASVVALFQNDVKRLLAYSSVAQVGYMVLGISLVTVDGLTGGIVHMFNHALMKCALFMAMGCVFLRVGSVHIADLRGIGKRMPVTMAAFVVGGLGLVGVPGTVGFVSKWYLVLGAVQSGLWPVAVVILLSSLIALAYVWRVVEVAYFEAPPEGCEVAGGRLSQEAPLSMLVPLWAAAGATIWFGIHTEWSAGVAARAAAVLLEVAS
jgi:multicomponent Na+:H+ antiporter subunit D